ncbi:hypothetical protein JOB18_012127 [Solea senegalensis]|uniref:Uncharacterized protein n=1 Tax=Solea senegalensis TaxID=28829 RepID=A0AAV6QH26_SOLSE|nr:hypothetical protein JOB18_012127 [Solea senegalensis]
MEGSITAALALTSPRSLCPTHSEEGRRRRSLSKSNVNRFMNHLLISELQQFNRRSISQRGFQSVYDAIESLRQISDVKSRLDKEKLQNEIRHICSKVADISD